MSPDVESRFSDRLRATADAAAGRAYGLEAVEHAGHARLVETALRAFGDDDRARFYVETLPPRGSVPRPDLIVVHPEIGCVVVECKGVGPGAIVGVEGQALRLRRGGRVKDQDPFRQAEKVMFRLKDELERRLRRGRPVFSRTAALPCLDRGDFERAHGVRWPRETLFAAEFASPEAFRTALLSLAAADRERAKRRRSWFANGADELDRIVRGLSPLFAPRQMRLSEVGADDGDGRLGVEIERRALAEAYPTRQQYEIADRRLAGRHWLFRGVAGSGKSVMLAMNAGRQLCDLVHLPGDEGPPRVLVCCFNKTLVPFLPSRVEERYRRLAFDEAPPPGSLDVVHVHGLLARLARAEPALKSDLPFDDRDGRAAQVAAAWDALPADRRRALGYDAVYLDESQDFEPNEFRLFARLARPDAETGLGTLAVFYDNAQNIYGRRPPIWRDLGVEIVGRTEFLDACHRNTPQTLDLAFNVLVGSRAEVGVRAETRRFADVANLRNRGLIEEGEADLVRTKFSRRDPGPQPTVETHPTRAAELDAACGHVRRLTRDEGVLPSDVLVLAKSFRDYPDLAARLRDAAGPNAAVRVVDPKHERNKALPLIEDDVLVASTVHSAKGYDAAVVILIGVDRFEADVDGRALFYVGATRAKHALIITAADGGRPTSDRLLPEVLAVAEALGCAVRRADREGTRGGG